MITAVVHPDTSLHLPEREVWVGVPIAGTEVPERAEIVAEGLRTAGATLVEPKPQPDATLTSVHDPGFIEFLSTAWERWQSSGYPRDPGQDRVVPYAFPAVTGVVGRRPVSIGALVGLYAMDTMTLIGPGSWEAISAAAACAATAADLAAGGLPHVMAVTRPPGHHAGRQFYGGSCYVNNAAVAAQRLRDHTAASVAIIDLDAHHGNGTQEIFYKRADVRYGSVHIDPGLGWFPHFVGFGDETGESAGSGHNLNLPVPEGTGDQPWLAAVEHLAEFSAGAGAVVVSLGVDAATDDPESPLTVTNNGYRRAGEIVGSLGVPTVAVLEGGYHLPTLAGLVASFLLGLTGQTEQGGGST